MPSPRDLARRVALHLGESVLAPLGLFYATEELAGLWPALGVSAAWAVGAIVVHLVRGGRPSTLLAAAAGMAGVQIGLTAAARSALVFFLQPTVATYGFALALLLTWRRARPLVRRLAEDFLTLPEALAGAPAVETLFRRLSLLWGSVLAWNATVTLVLLLTVSTTWAVPAATTGSVPVFALGLLVSLRWFRGAVRAAGLRIRWGDPAGAVAPPEDA